MKTYLLLIVLALLALPCRAGGASADSSAAPARPHLQDIASTATQVPDTSGMIVRTAFSLAVVVMLVWGAVYLMRRLSGNAPSPGGQSHVRVLERAYVAPKKAIYIVQIGSRSLAVGVTDAQMTTLAELDSDETRAAYPARGDGSAPVRFATLLKDVRSRFWGEQTPGSAP